jgi:PTH1 family peptidyl-tRNA hydrolase
MFGRRKGPDRTGTPADLLVVGLGNPGDRYAGTRHNVGAEVVELLAERHGERLRATKEAALVAEMHVDGRRLVVAFPQTFMNESGRSVRDLVRRHGIEDPRDVVVIHDELDLEPGRTKLKVGCGLAGHNGLKSIDQHLKGSGFTRMRIGIGRPPGRQSPADYVLRRPGKADRIELDIQVERAADAVERILRDGVDVVMNEFNR